MSLVKKITVLTFGKGLNIIVNLLFLPYMARVLSYEDYGSYGQVILVSAFVGAFLSFGLSQIIYVYLSKENNPKEVLFSNLFTLLVMGALGSIFMFGLSSYTASWFDNPQLSFLVKVFSISLLFQLPFQSMVSYLIFVGKVKRTVSITISTNILKVVLVIGAIQLYNSVSLALIAIVISYVFQLLYAYLSIKSDLSFSIDFKRCLNQLKDGFPLGLTALFGSGILYIDGLMVSSMEGVKSYAIYRNGAIEVPFISTLYASIAAIILPEVSKLYANQQFEEIVFLKKKVIMNTMMITYPILIFFLFNARDTIIIYLGEKYISSAIIFAIFNLTLLIRINDYHDILIAANKSKIILYNYFIIFILNAILNYAFISLLGIAGAAIATVLSLLCFSILMFHSSAISLKVKILDFINLKDFFYLLIMSFTIGVIVKFLTIGIEYKLLRLIIFSLTYFPTIYLMIYKVGLITSDEINSKIKKIFTFKRR